ncbi:hypothetical protein BDZ91DRAFT_754686 [Kalaharituber pfeilii]|nr:hypothetical protein BDZ91DRAFT_754686 [Kalaharituber pfeilii]
MHLKSTLFTGLLSLLAIAAPVLSAVVPVGDSCSTEDHPCNLYIQYKPCSEDWHALLDKCILSGCIQWIRDPKAECALDCNAKDHPCNTYQSYEECSDKWLQLIDQCIPTQCILWVRDPRTVCLDKRTELDCSAPLHPCNTYIQFQECSRPWLATLDQCIATGCINWFQDPKAVCYNR